MVTRRSAKQKGRDYQKEIATRIREEYGLGERDVVSTPASVSGVDIILSEKAKECFPFAVECKRQEKASIWQWIAQSEKNAGKEIPITVFRRNHGNSYVLVSWENFLKVLTQNMHNHE